MEYRQYEGIIVHDNVTVRKPFRQGILLQSLGCLGGEHCHDYVLEGSLCFINMIREGHLQRTPTVVV